MRNRALLVLAVVIACGAAIWMRGIRLGLDLRGGASLVLQVHVPPGANRGEIVSQTREVIERRINAYGLSEAPVQPYGDGSQLLVQLPGVSDVGRIKHSLQTQAVLEWRAVVAGPFSGLEEANRAMTLGSKAFAMAKGPDWFLLSATPVVRGSDVRNARAERSETGGTVTTFVLSQEAGKRFEQYTAANIGQRASIVLDGRIISVATIESKIGDTGQIRGIGTPDEAEDLARNLRAGSLPAEITVLQEHVVEASLGADSIRRGLEAGFAGLAAVIVAMLFYYRRAGVNATIALALNGLILIAALSSLDAVLTLPGIAGVILTMGMAVDSNVLIFERIREELRSGKVVRAAISAGFSKAFGTIVDTHVTTVVSCAFLFAFGTAAVKGFAITLVLGLLSNVFTAVFVSKLLFEWETSRPGADFGQGLLG